MIPVNSVERLHEIRKHYEAGHPMAFAGGHYVIVSMEYDTHTEGGSFAVREVRLIDDPAKDASVRDAVMSTRRDWPGEREND